MAKNFKYAQPTVDQGVPFLGKVLSVGSGTFRTQDLDLLDMQAEIIKQMRLMNIKLQCLQADEDQLDPNDIDELDHLQGVEIQGD